MESLHCADFTHFNTHSLEKCHLSFNCCQVGDIRESFNSNQNHQEFNPIIIGLDPERWKKFTCIAHGGMCPLVLKVLKPEKSVNADCSVKKMARKRSHSLSYSLELNRVIPLTETKRLILQKSQKGIFLLTLNIWRRCLDTRWQYKTLIKFFLF